MTKPKLIVLVAIWAVVYLIAFIAELLFLFG